MVKYKNKTADDQHRHHGQMKDEYIKGRPGNFRKFPEWLYTEKEITETAWHNLPLTRVWYAEDSAWLRWLK